MRFAFTDEQQEFALTARRWAADAFGVQVASDLLSGKPVEIEKRWKEIADLGWIGIATPEDRGGAGGSIVDACLVVEALAEHWAPIPLGGALVASVALTRLPTDPALEGALEALVGGEQRCTVLLDRDLSWGATSGEGVAWEGLEGDTVIGISGEITEPVHGQVHPFQTRDLTRPMSLVTGSVPLDPPGEAALPVLTAGLVLTAAGLVGTMSGALALARNHALDRRQFGQPIGGFQAVQHLLADIYVDLESSRSALYGAAWALDNAEAQEALWAAAVAKAWTSAAARRSTENAIQVLGGIGMTWEHPAHLFLRSAHVLGAAFATRTAALDLVAGRLMTAS